MADRTDPPPKATGTVTFRVPPEAQQLTSRRVSFRSTVSDSSLPENYLEALEAKRRQLDESIHKYIASKEREYKNFEKDVRGQHKISSLNAASSSPAGAGPVTSAGQNDSIAPSNEFKRRSNLGSKTTVAPSTLVGSGSPGTSRASNAHAHNEKPTHDPDVLDDRQLWTETKAAMAGITNRRESSERDRDFAGLFTPTFLAAIDRNSKTGEPEYDLTDRSTMLRETVTKTQPSPEDKQQVQSDSVVVDGAQAKAKRPKQLQVASRTSSSGSSVDGKLTSALKSPTQRERPSRKRVSLAVGDTIVAPSDSVPASELIAHSFAPSHSRTRSPHADSHVTDLTVHDDETYELLQSAPRFTEGSARPLASVMTTSGRTTYPKATEVTQSGPTTSPGSLSSPRSSPKRRSSSKVPIASSKIDPDGDLFDLAEMEDEEFASSRSEGRYDRDEDAIEWESPDEDEITGRIDPEDLDSTEVRAGSVSHDENFDRNSGDVLGPDATQAVTISHYAEDDGAVQIDYHPLSASASQQPTEPGFRRPSVSADPIFRGSLLDYATAESKAVEDETYGSKFVQGSNKSSFRGGSLGESFMERNAAELMRLRASRHEAAVK